MEDIREYSFQFTDIPNDISGAFLDRFQECMSMVMSAVAKEVITPEVYKQCYEKSMFIEKLHDINIDGVFEAENVTDPASKVSFANQVKQKLSENLNDILSDPRLVSNMFNVDDDKKLVTASYMTDHTRVSEYFVDVLNSTCAYVWDEFKTFRDRSVKVDVQNMKSLYMESRSWKEEEFLDKINEFSTKIGGGLSSKYFPIIMFFSVHGFDEKVFEECVLYWINHASKSRKDICMRYFKRSLPKNSSYNTAIINIGRVIDQFELEVAKQKEEFNRKKDEITMGNVAGKKKYYESLMTEDRGQSN